MIYEFSIKGSFKRRIKAEGLIMGVLMYWRALDKTLGVRRSRKLDTSVMDVELIEA